MCHPVPTNLKNTITIDAASFWRGAIFNSQVTYKLISTYSTKQIKEKVDNRCSEYFIRFLLTLFKTESSEH